LDFLLISPSLMISTPFSCLDDPESTGHLFIKAQRFIEMTETSSTFYVFIVD
jgi:hypothetical protein